MARLCRAMCTSLRRAKYTQMYTDRDLIFYLSYNHCLQTVNMLFNEQKWTHKGTQLRYDLIDFKKVVTMTSMTLSEYKVSEPHTFIDGHENNNGTLGYEQFVAQRYSFLCLSKNV